MEFQVDFEDAMEIFARLIPNSFNAMENEHNFMEYPLVVAVVRGDRHKVKMLLQRGEDCNEKDRDGRPPLHYAAFIGHLAIAKDLIEAGSDINAKDSEYNTPLIFAALNCSEGIVKLLLSAKVDVNSKNEFGVTALHMAAEIGNVNIVKALLAAGAKIDAKTLKHSTALHVSIRNNKFAVFNILIDSGADVNALASRYLTPLMMSLDGKFPIEGIKKLILKSADVNARDERRLSPLLTAIIRNCCPTVVEFLLESGADSKAKSRRGRTALHLLAENLDIDEKERRKIAKLLVSYGADIHALEYEHRWTPLQWAAHFMQKELVIFLLEECGANANEGELSTPLHIAVKSGQENVSNQYFGSNRVNQFRKYQIINSLLQHGADPNARDAQERTPFYFAAENSEFDIVRLLLINGSCYDAKAYTVINQLPVDVSTLNSDQRVGELIVLVERFFKAICKNDLDKVKKLVTKDKFLVVCRSAHYKTSLHYPSWKGFTEMVKLLLDFGADPNSANSLYSSPLHYAAKFNNPEVVDVLLSRGAYFDAICPLTNKTPKTVAREAKNVASLLVLSKIESLFAEVKIGNNDVIRQLKSFKDKDEKAHLVIQGAKNKEGKRLIDVALDSRHGDISDYLANLEVKF